MNLWKKARDELSFFWFVTVSNLSQCRISTRNWASKSMFFLPLITYVRVNSSHEHPPRVETPGIWYKMSPGSCAFAPLGHLQKKTCFILSCRHSVNSDGAQKSSILKTPLFWNIDQKRPIKTIKPFVLSLSGRNVSFLDPIQHETIWLFTFDSYIVYCILVLWTWGPDIWPSYIVRRGGGAFANENCPQGRVFD